MSAPAIEVAGLHKAFGDNHVLKGIDFTVQPGTVYALLGPNGAGKTTVVRTLTTLIASDAGTATVFGHDVAHEPDAIRRDIGVTGQFSAVDELLTGHENLQLMADLNHLPRAGGAPARRTCSSASTWSMRETAVRKPTPAACGVVSTSP